MIKKIWIKIWNIIASSLAFLFLLSGTVFTYYYANGYRLNPINGEIKQTGVISIETNPTKTEVTVNGKVLGKSPKITAVDIGQASVSITKEGYHNWEKSVEVVPEKSTNLKPNLFYTTMQAESVYSLDTKVINQISDSVSNNIYLTILQGNKYTILKYRTDRFFWNISENPITLYETSSSNIKNLETSYSKDFEWVLITKTTTKEKTFEMVKLSSATQPIKLDELKSFSQDYRFSWSENSNYLILESNQDIIAYKYSDGTKYLLLKKSSKQEYIWTTDRNESFYYLSKKIDSDYITVTIYQTTLQGNSKRIALENVYFGNTDKYIPELIKQEQEYQPMTNSKENVIFAGDVTSFRVFPEANGVLIKTKYATYWYDQTTEKYVLVSTKNIEFVKMSPDNYKFIYLETETHNYVVFTFNKVEADPLYTLGTKTVLTGDNIKEISWSSDSQNIFFLDSDSLFTIEYDGNNSHKLIEGIKGVYTQTNDIQYVYTVKSSENKFEIDRYKMN